MEPKQWELVQAIFNETVDLPPGERTAAVMERCKENTALAEDVFAILAADQAPQPLLDLPKAELLAAAAHWSEPSPMAGQQIGPYRIVSLLGEGGMGVVYLAARTDMGGQVALKLLPDARFSPMRRARFANEQRTMAQLQHPGIARIYDCGTLGDGTPWFAMEYVAGVPLTAYWRGNKGTMKERLLFFKKVCEAVEFAHQHAIVHRDLKPSNILVTPRGEAKLLDFGIAKQLDTEADKSRTVTDLRMMTLAYAAPEQQSGGTVGVYTDVYSLGLVLFELLAGRLPSRGDLSGVDPRARFEIKESPSRCLRDSNAEEYRLASRAEWVDLDAICFTATQFEPARRYKSVSALIQDIEAFVAARPLQARPQTLAYRCGKFIRRHRASILAAACMAVLLAVTSLFFVVRLTRARRVAAAEAARTERAQQFTENLFAGGDPEAGPAENLKVTELLDRGRQEADSLRADPELQSEMRSTLGKIYEKLGDLNVAQGLLEAALLQRQGAPAPNLLKLAESYRDLGNLRKDQGKLAEAERLVQRSLDIENQIVPRNGVQMERSLMSLGAILNKEGQYDRAKAVLQSAIQMHPRNASPSPDAANEIAELATANYYQSNLDAAKSLDLEALKMRREISGDRNPEVADLLNALGAIALDKGNYPEAEDDYRQAVGITEAWYGADHPETAANLTSLARSLSFEKRYDEARTALNRALLIQEHVHGHEHSMVAFALNELGSLAYLQSQDREAEKDFQSALDIWLKVYGPHHQFIGVAYSNLGGVYAAEKDYPKAEAYYRLAIQHFREAVSENHVNTAIAHFKLGRMLVHENRLDDAEQELLTAFRYLSANVSSTNTFLVACRKSLFEIYTRKNLPEKAASFHAKP